MSVHCVSFSCFYHPLEYKISTKLAEKSCNKMAIGVRQTAWLGPENMTVAHNSFQNERWFQQNLNQLEIDKDFYLHIRTKHWTSGQHICAFFGNKKLRSWAYFGLKFKTFFCFIIGYQYRVNNLNIFEKLLF